MTQVVLLHFILHVLGGGGRTYITYSLSTKLFPGSAIHIEKPAAQYKEILAPLCKIHDKIVRSLKICDPIVLWV